jgi:hypothetical protein
MLVVVVLPCVPATTSERRPRMNSSLTTSACDRYSRRRFSVSSSSGLPRGMALPTTTQSGAGSRLAAR